MRSEGVDLSGAYSEYLQGDYKNACTMLQRIAKQSGDKNYYVVHNINICEYLQNRSPLHAVNILTKLMDLIVDMNKPIKVKAAPPPPVKNNKNQQQQQQAQVIEQIMGQYDNGVLKYNVALLFGVIGRRDNMEMVLTELFNSSNNYFSWKIAFLLAESQLLTENKLDAVETIARLSTLKVCPRRASKELSNTDKTSKPKFTGLTFPDANNQQALISNQEYNFVLGLFASELLLKFGLTRSAQKILPKRDNEPIFSVIRDCFSYKSSNSFELNLVTMLKFATAHLQYHNRCFMKALKLLSPHSLMEMEINSPKYMNYVTALALNNTGLVNFRLEKYTLALYYVSKALENLTKTNASLTDEREQILAQHFLGKTQFLQLNQALLLLKNQSYAQAYEHFGRISKSTKNFKFWYRYGETSLKHFHELLEENAAVHDSDLYQQILDNYETSYHYPNEPYVKQHDDKRRAPNAANLQKPYYRRFVLHHADQFPQEDNPEDDRRSGKRQSSLIHVKQILNKAQNCFESCLLCLEHSDWERKVENLDIVGIGESVASEIESQQEEIQTKKTLLQEFYNFKQSSMLMLAYIALCKQQYPKTIKICREILALPRLNDETGYTASIYLTEAYLETEKYKEAIDMSLSKYLKLGLKEHSAVPCRDTLASSQSYMEQMSHDNVVRYNMAVLHIKGNNFAQANNVIKQMLAEMGIVQNSCTANMPRSVLNLLIYWYLRTDNAWSALQLIKRKRLLTLPSLNNMKALLKITK